MMMTSREHNARARKRTTRNIFLAILAVLVIAVFNVWNVNPFRMPANALAGGALRLESGLASRVGLFAELLQSKRSLALENAALRQKNAEQSNLAAANKALEKENTDLKFLLGRTNSTNRILASVLSKPDVSPYDTLIIDVGTNDGVHVGDKVVADGDFVVGFVSNVYPSTAQVTFYSSPGQKTQVLIGDAGIGATAEGRGANNFAAQLPRDIKIAKGDIVTLASFNTQVFAVVKDITSNSTDAFQTILFNNPVNIFTLGWVEVVRSEAQTP